MKSNTFSCVVALLWHPTWSYLSYPQRKATKWPRTPSVFPNPHFKCWKWIRGGLSVPETGSVLYFFKLLVLKSLLLDIIQSLYSGFSFCTKLQLCCDCRKHRCSTSSHQTLAPISPLHLNWRSTRFRLYKLQVNFHLLDAFPLHGQGATWLPTRFHNPGDYRKWSLEDEEEFNQQPNEQWHQQLSFCPYLRVRSH